MDQSSGGHSTLFPVKPSSGPPSLPSPKEATIRLERLEITSSLGAALHHPPQLPYHSFDANAVSPSLHPAIRVSLTQASAAMQRASLSSGDGAGG